MSGNQPKRKSILAQELVDKVIQIKELNDEVNLLKLEVYDDAQGGVHCKGGRIFFVDQGITSRLDRSKLIENLMQQFQVSESNAKNIIKLSLVENERLPYISVYLDR